MKQLQSFWCWQWAMHTQIENVKQLCYFTVLKQTELTSFEKSKRAWKLLRKGVGLKLWTTLQSLINVKLCH